MKKLILSAFILTVQTVTAQEGVTPPAINIAEHVPQSPTVAGLSKYFDVPVNMNTGQPNISIPIYTIKTGNITVPVTLSYNAGGIRVNEHAGWVGMGWSINTGGIINKRVNGFDDFSTSLQSVGTLNQMDPYVIPGYAHFGMPISNISDIVDSFNFNTNSQVSSTQYANFFARIGNGNVDAEADEYFYSTPQGGGKLFYNQRRGAFEMDKYNGWKASHTFTGDGHDVTGFTLESNNGIVYEFGSGDYYRNPLDYLPSNNVGAGPTQAYFNQAWHLSTIKDIVNKKQVGFSSNSVYKTTRNGFSANMVYQLQVFGQYTYKSEDVRENLRMGTEITPSSIIFDEGSILFIQDTQSRLDGGTNALKEIQVRNREGKLMKKYVFTYMYVQSGGYYGCPYQQYQYGNNYNICDTLSRRMYLQSVQEIYAGSNNEVVSMPPYQFRYNNPEQLPGRLSFAQDKWGYYNGKLNTTLIASLPQAFINMGIPVMGNREVDTAYTQKGLLTEIEYPTGGKLLIEMEPNVYEGGIVGGLRTKRLTNKDNITGQTLVTEYAYAQAAMQFPPKHYYEYHNFQGFGGGNSPKEIRMEGEPLYSLLNGQGSPVQYNIVTKKQMGDGQELVSKHYFNNVVQPGYGQFTSGELGVPRPKNPAMEGFLGLEDATEIYGPNGVLLQKDSMVHEPLNDFSFHIWNIQAAVASPSFLKEWIIWPGNDPFFTIPPNVGTAMNYYAHFKENAIKTKQFRLTYDDGIKSTNYSTYVYDKTNSNLLLSRSVNSRGDTLISKYKYTTNYLPANPISIADAQLAYMYEINTISKPVEITSFIKKKNAADSLLTGAAFFEYDSARVKKVYKLPLQQPISNFTPSYLGASGLVKDGRYELETSIIAKDAAGNPLTVEEKSGTAALIWDGVNDVLAAKVANAVHTDVAYCSFENESSGNWNIASPLRDATTAITGKKAYNLMHGSITKTGLDGSKIFTVSYWSKNGPHSVNGSNTATAGSTINGFTYYEHTVNYVTTIAVSGSGIIDELRLYPQKALMNSYTYNPMVGITSQCDANNNIQYYEYDAMGRLKAARDRSSNILKQYDYRYKTLITQ